MAKTKVQLENELRETRGKLQYSKKMEDHWWDKFEEAMDELRAVNDKVRSLESLEEKYNAFVANHCNICEAHTAQMDETEGQLDHAVEEVKKLREKVTAQEGRIMVCETAMRSMTMHILILEQRKKGKDNA